MDFVLEQLFVFLLGFYITDLNPLLVIHTNLLPLQYL